MRRETSSMSMANAMSEIFIIEGRKASWTYDEACREFKAPNLHTYPSRLWYGKILTHWLFFSHFIHVFLCCSILISEIDFLSANLFFLHAAVDDIDSRWLYFGGESEISCLFFVMWAAVAAFLCCCSMMRDSLVNCFFCISFTRSQYIFFTQAAIFISVRCDDIKDTFNKEKNNFY